MGNAAQGTERGAGGAEGHGQEEDGGLGGFARQTSVEAETMWRDRDRQRQAKAPGIGQDGDGMALYESQASASGAPREIISSK